MESSNSLAGLIFSVMLSEAKHLALKLYFGLEILHHHKNVASCVQNDMFRILLVSPEVYKNQSS
jgi:hypothetical protein